MYYEKEKQRKRDKIFILLLGLESVSLFMYCEKNTMLIYSNPSKARPSNQSRETVDKIKFRKKKSLWSRQYKDSHLHTFSAVLRMATRWQWVLQHRLWKCHRCCLPPLLFSLFRGKRPQLLKEILHYRFNVLLKIISIKTCFFKRDSNKRKVRWSSARSIAIRAAWKGVRFVCHSHRVQVSL